MAVIQRPSTLPVDPAPLWLPFHDALVVEQASARPPDHVDGYTAGSRLATLFLGSRWKIAATVSTSIAVLLFVVMLPSLFDAGVGTLLKVSLYQSWTLGLLLVATTRVRSISVGTAARYWLAGMFAVAMLSSLVIGPLAATMSSSSVWITPVLEEMLKALPLVAAVVIGRRVWRHPGLSDLMVLGFAVGAGYSFHEEALWQRPAPSGFKPITGLLVPSIFQQDGAFVVGQAVWTSLVGLAVGLVILHRRHPAAAVGALILGVAVIVDHMSVNATGETLDVARQLLYNGKIMALVFVVGVVAAVVLDTRRLAAIAVRDHLFPSELAQGSYRPSSNVPSDPLEGLLVSRYRRLRNGMHTTVDATTEQWPPLCAVHPAPIAELARLGRAAQVAVGPGTSSSGWAPDPQSPAGFRFVGDSGFTPYVTDGYPAQTASVSTPKGRPDVTGTPRLERAADFWQFVGVGVVAAGLYVLVRLLTAGEPSSTDLETVFALPEAANSPALIVGVLGALATVVSIRGRNPARLEAGWTVGPGYDPSPDRPDECEA